MSPFILSLSSAYGEFARQILAQFYYFPRKKLRAVNLEYSVLAPFDLCNVRVFLNLYSWYARLRNNYGLIVAWICASCYYQLVMTIRRGELSLTHQIPGSSN